MTDYTELQKAAEYAAQDTIKFADESEEMRALQQFHEEVDPETVLALIAENESLKGPHDWLAEDLIKELVDNAQAIQENSDDGEEDPFVVVLLASASRIRRQEANIDKLRAENEQLAKTADCWDRLNIQNKALSDSFRAERDQLKAENEALLAAAQALRDEWRKDQADAERHRWLRDSSQHDWDVSYGKLEIRIETPHVDSSDLDACIDAAMGKGERGGQSTSKTSENADPEGSKGGGQ